MIGLSKDIAGNLRDILREDKLIFTDGELQNGYDVVYKLISTIRSVDDIDIATIVYMAYYYEYLLDKGDRDCCYYNYIKTLEDDYDNLKIMIEYIKDYNNIKYGEL